MVRNNLDQALEDMSRFHRNKDSLIYAYINDRLNKSLKSYYSELTESVEYLNSKDDLRIAKRLNNDE